MTTSRAKVRLINRLFVRSMVTAAIAILFSITPAWSQKPGGKRGVDVATINLYVGADFTPLTTLNPEDPAFPLQLVIKSRDDTRLHHRIELSGAGSSIGAGDRRPIAGHRRASGSFSPQAPVSGRFDRWGKCSGDHSRTGLSADSACRSAPIWWPLCRRFTGSELGCGTAAGDRPVHIR